MTIVSSSNFAKALYPGVSSWYGKEYDEFPVEYTDLFETYQSRRAWEEDVGTSGFGLLSVKPEGMPITYQSEQQAFTTRYTHVNYASGFIVTEEMFEDDLYDIVAEKRARSLAFSTRQTKEVVGANIYNRAFNSSYTYGDGSALIVSSHPNVSGGTWSNVLATPANLSEVALEQSCIDIAKFTNDAGLRIAIMPQSIIIPVDLQFEAERILKSQYRIGTSNNDINALVSMGKFPGGIKMNHYLTSTTAWFIRTNCPDGMKHFVRKDDTFAEDNDFDTANAKFKVQGRYSFGNTDPRAIYGTAGV